MPSSTRSSGGQQPGRGHTAGIGCRHRPRHGQRPEGPLSDRWRSWPPRPAKPCWPRRRLRRGRSCRPPQWPAPPDPSVAVRDPASSGRAPWRSGRVPKRSQPADHPTRRASRQRDADGDAAGATIRAAHAHPRHARARQRGLDRPASPASLLLARGGPAGGSRSRSSSWLPASRHPRSSPAGPGQRGPRTGTAGPPARHAARAARRCHGRGDDSGRAGPQLRPGRAERRVRLRHQSRHNVVTVLSTATDLVSGTFRDPPGPAPVRLVLAGQPDRLRQRLHHKRRGAPHRVHRHRYQHRDGHRPGEQPHTGPLDDKPGRSVPLRAEPQHG